MHQVKCITLTSVVYDYASVWFILCVCATIFGVVIVKDDIINKIPNEYRKMCGIVLSFFLHPIHLYIDLSFVSADNAFAAPIRRNNEWSHLKYIQCEVAQLCGKTANIKMSRTKNYAVFCVCLCQTYFIGYSILSPFAMRCNWTQPFSHNQRYRCLKSQTLWISSKIFFPKLNTWKSVKIATETTASIHFDTNSRKKHTHGMYNNELRVLVSVRACNSNIPAFVEFQKCIHMPKNERGNVIVWMLQGHCVKNSHKHQWNILVMGKKGPS